VREKKTVVLSPSILQLCSSVLTNLTLGREATEEIKHQRKQEVLKVWELISTYLSFKHIPTNSGPCRAVGKGVRQHSADKVLLLYLGALGSGKTLESAWI
jgi:hypothetical protein